MSDLHEMLDSGFKSKLVDISKLICEVWIEEPRGKKFKNALTSSRDVKAALRICNIDVPDKVKFELDTSTYNGSIDIEEDLTAGLTFSWKLPYAAWPQTGITKEELEAWIAKCDKWMASASSNPKQDFPTPNNIYIPLATF
jgi:hypothetical protein